MEYKAGLLVFITLLIGSFAFPTPEDDMSIFFDHTDANARIVGGTESAVGGHPHMVALLVGAIVTEYYCGASLVTQRTVLTAAHCIQNIYNNDAFLSSARISVGSNRFDSGTEYPMVNSVIHPDYDRDIIKNDIGIIITGSDVAYNDLVQPVSLSYSFVGAGVPAIVAGWGTTSSTRPISAVLLELRTTTIDGEDCIGRVKQAASQMGYDFLYTDPSLEVCTLHSPGFGTCNGDSGSALRRVDDGQQFGIVSWGFPCARGHPDLFVRVSAYETWLKSVIV
ncbi:chymotrypsin-1-like [Spodoptera litura]|uniref:Chymotrypsin-1-like n=1 Tax=Spodoptera litura TaxID=69820 RepID=A0A9J7EG08_SPOLT|nr:chymotrypsin-1-like [Spodoptera litura]